ncbi:hypothetical protein MTO96_041385 [Rhipicephalus appendiculatus]
MQKKLKLSHQPERRLKTKVTSLSEIVDDLKSKRLVSDDDCAMLGKCFSGVLLEVMRRLLKQSNESDEPARPSREKYSSTLRMFALTLQFY